VVLLNFRFIKWIALLILVLNLLEISPQFFVTYWRIEIFELVPGKHSLEEKEQKLDASEFVVEGREQELALLRNSPVNFSRY